MAARALAFVLVRSARGRIVQMVRRLKEPRYLFGFLIGAGWVLFWVSRVFLGNDWDGNIQFGMSEQLLEMAGPMAQGIQLVLATVLTVAVLLWWAVPFGRSSLEFTEPELHMLLPAPVSRRALIQYGVLKSQPGIFIGVAITSFFMGPKTLPGFAGAAVTFWLLFTLWDLHAKGRGLWYASLDEMPGAQRWRRQILLWVVAFAGILVIGALAVQIGLEFLALPLPDLENFDEGVGFEGQRWAAEFGSLAWNSTLAWILMPALLVLRPLFAGLTGNAGAWLAALAVPAVLVVAHNEWVVRSQSRFEERELAQARRRSRQKADPSNFWRRTRMRRRWQPFALASSGPPEVAIVWKNLMQVQRIPLVVAFAVPLALAALVLLLIVIGLLPAWITPVLQVSALALMLLPPLFNARATRADLRTDLLRLEIMRTVPVAPARLFAAELAAPVIIVMLQVAFGMLLFLGLDGLVELGLVEGNADMKQQVADFLRTPRLALLPLAFIGYLPVALVVTVLTSSLENLAALAFPGWVQLGPQGKQAASKFGQNIIVFMALSIVMFAGLLPGVLAVGGIVAVQVLVWGVPVWGWELPLLGLAGALPIGAVVAALIAFGGGLWSRLDPSAELLAGRS